MPQSNLIFLSFFRTQFRGFLGLFFNNPKSLTHNFYRKKHFYRYLFISRPNLGSEAISFFTNLNSKTHFSMKSIYIYLLTLSTILVAAQPTASESDHVYALDVSTGSCQSPVSSSSSSDISANIITSTLPLSCLASFSPSSYSAIWLSVVAPDSGKLSFVTGRSSTRAHNIYTSLYSKNQNDEYNEVLCQSNQISAVTASNLSPGETYYLQLVDHDDYGYGGSRHLEGGFYACAWNPEPLSHAVEEKVVLSYNNPFGNRMRLESPHIIQTLWVFDLMGKEVLRKTPNQQKLSLNTYSLAPGAYLLRVETPEGQQTVKLIKK